MDRQVHNYFVIPAGLKEMGNLPIEPLPQSGPRRHRVVAEQAGDDLDEQAH